MKPPFFSWGILILRQRPSWLGTGVFCRMGSGYMSSLHLKETQTSEERVREIVQGVIGERPLFVVAVEVRGARGTGVVDIYVDSDTELDVETLAGLSREIGFILDAEDVLQGKYRLDVSSPGVDRPLALPRQYRKNKGRELLVKYKTKEDSDIASIKGKLTEADEEAIVLSVSKDKTLRLEYDNILEAKVQLPW